VSSTGMTADGHWNDSLRRCVDLWDSGMTVNVAVLSCGALE